MRRIKLTVAYDGTDYCGWQVQPNGITIEEVLNRALSRLTGEDIAVTGASRTDAGVHAEGNVAVFDTASTIPPERFAYAVNPLLPEDIVVVKSEEVPPDWHPRHQASVKTYEYRILNREMPDQDDRAHGFQPGRGAGGRPDHAPDQRERVPLQHGQDHHRHTG